MRKIVCLVGTRPEVIKVAPVIQALINENWCKPILITSGQHVELLEQQLQVFNLKPDNSIHVMQEGQSLSSLTSRLFSALEKVLSDEKPDMVLAQGDTTTVMVASVLCFYLGIPFCHLEAGLRSYSMHRPFPEEFNRRVASITAAIHLAPTQSAKQALLNEGIDSKTITVTGNTVIDSLYYMRERISQCPYPVNKNNKMILLTAHRRENFGHPLEQIFLCLKNFIIKNKDIELVYPVHPNPNVAVLANDILGEVENIHLIKALDYADFISLMNNSYIIISDSGGVQEEAPALGKPVLVLREVTEREEAVRVGAAKLIGTNPRLLQENLEKLLFDKDVYRGMSRGISPYGDGKAASRATTTMRNFFSKNKNMVIDEFS